MQRIARVLILLLLCLFQAEFALAQLGIKLGYGLSALVQVGADEDAAGDYRSYFGYETDALDGYPADGIQLGVSYAMPLTGAVTVQPEVHYAQRGMDGYANGLYRTTYRLKIDYIEIAAPVYLQPWPGLTVKPMLFAGPYLAGLIGATREVSVWGETESQDVDHILGIDAGLVGGIGAGLDTSHGFWTVEMRLTWGLARAAAEPDDYTPLYVDPGSMHTAAVSLMLGFQLR